MSSCSDERSTAAPPAVARDTRRRSWIGLAQVSAAGVLWGTMGVGVLLVRRHAPLSALTIGAYRAAIAGVLLLIVALVAGWRRRIASLLRRHAPRVMALGVFTAASQLLYLVSVVAVSVSVATVVCLGVAPVLVTAVTSIRRRRPPTVVEAVPVVVAVVGLVLVSDSPAEGVGGNAPALGIVCAAASGISYAAVIMLGEPVSRQVEPLILTAATVPIAAAVLIPVASVVAVARNEPMGTHSAPALILLVYLGAVTLAMTYGLLYSGLRTTPSHAAVIATLLEPATAVVLAALILDERLGPAGIVGVVMILAAVAALAPRAGPPEASVH